ncbi:hypothetical protein M406DRAFT_337866 [Cryphonectria parasitica EP155]|uniref:F-box domain-containing protein n=1 Tax=Cryphonectria parasitica (strain ATCC 38755 / EP155) TaxID=660469 RepID=A0A9P5CQ88_CRYP1|nr:uncharacterized protein M406DRAFT_337866 [Cryphonectria parasitica EP155]KAF3766968.1 hypothetical protein M406DRAFT_337866 [Cryphonectria parasitica EP155]
MASVPQHVDDLPSEILIQILSPMTTLELLPLALINHRFHDLALRIIHTRLTDAARLPDHELILEAYHPSAKISTPYLHCDYLGTDGLAGYDEDEDKQLTLGQLRGLYSRFRPVVQEENRRARARYPRASSGLDSAAQQEDEDEEDDEHTASVNIQLDDGEMFSQLCAVTNLVKTGPRRGLFLSHVNVNDGVVRVFRRWLKAKVSSGAAAEGDKEQILWTSRHKTVGLKFRVRENVDSRRPALWSEAEDDDLPVSYTLVYEELLVRTSTLLLEVEKSEEQEVTSSGKAIVIASI